MIRYQPCMARVTTRLLSTSKKGDTMATVKVETLRAAHESWNRRDFAGEVRTSAESLVYTDNARSLSHNGPDKFREWTEAWAKQLAASMFSKSSPTKRSARRAFPMCAEKGRQLEGESPFDNLMEVKS